jgi:hypothetical protein
MEKINIEFARETAPYFVFFERILTRPVEVFSFLISHGYGYLLKRFICRYDGVNTATGTLAAPLFVEFFDNYNGRARQVQPSPLPLLSTPNHGGNIEQEIQGGPFDLFTVRTGRKSEKILNFNYPYMDTLRFQISGGGVPMKSYTGDRYPSIEIMLEGYYVPEQSLEQWEKVKQSQKAEAERRVKWLKL